MANSPEFEERIRRQEQEALTKAKQASTQAETLSKTAEGLLAANKIPDSPLRSRIIIAHQDAATAWKSVVHTTYDRDIGNDALKKSNYHAKEAEKWGDLNAKYRSEWLNAR